MTDLISRSTVIDRIAEFLGPKGLDEWEVMVAIREIIEAAPAIDAAPVVRCKDCTWFNRGYCMRFDDDVIPDDFCSRGHTET